MSYQIQPLADAIFPKCDQNLIFTTAKINTMTKCIYFSLPFQFEARKRKKSLQDDDDDQIQKASF